MFDNDSLFDLFTQSDRIADKYLTAADIAARNAALMTATLDVYAVLPHDDAQ